jgi:hypothetical protein
VAVGVAPAAGGNDFGRIGQSSIFHWNTGKSWVFAGSVSAEAFTANHRHESTVLSGVVGGGVAAADVPVVCP